MKHRKLRSHFSAQKLNKMVPTTIKKHPYQALGIATVGLGVISGLVWYSMKK